METIIGHLLFPRHCCAHLTYIISLNFQGILLSPFYEWQDRGREILNNFTHNSANDRAKIQTQAVWLQSLGFKSPLRPPFPTSRKGSGIRLERKEAKSRWGFGALWGFELYSVAPEYKLLRKKITLHVCFRNIIMVLEQGMDLRGRGTIRGLTTKKLEKKQWGLCARGRVKRSLSEREVGVESDNPDNFWCAGEKKRVEHDQPAVWPGSSHTGRHFTGTGTTWGRAHMDGEWGDTRCQV